jgi:hypothetical protein
MVIADGGARKRRKSHKQIRQKPQANAAKAISKCGKSHKQKSSVPLALLLEDSAADSSPQAVPN